jgi:hypothetical protein
MRKLILILLLTSSFSYGQQDAYPISDVTFAWLGGTPTNTAGNRYQNIDEVTPISDSDYTYSQNNPNGAIAEFGLTVLTDPQSSTGHILIIRHAQIDEDSGSHPLFADTGGSATSLAWELKQGATIITSGSVSPAGFTNMSYTLTGTEADNISDYSDLRVYLTPSGGAGNPSNRRAVAVSRITFQVPNAPVGGARRIMIINK